MPELLVAVMVLVGLALVMFGLALFARRVRRTGTAGAAIGAAMAAYDEAMNSTAHTRYEEMRAQKDRSAASPAPGDPELGD